MSQMWRARPRAAVLLAVTVGLGVSGLAACASSDAQVETTVAVTATQPSATISTEGGSEPLVLSDDEVADLERQLDEIDQLLAGVDADLSQD